MVSILMLTAAITSTLIELLKLLAPGLWVFLGAWVGARFASKNMQLQLAEQSRLQLASKSQEETSKKLQELHALAVDRYQKVTDMLRLSWIDDDGFPLHEEWAKELAALAEMFRAAERAAHRAGFWLSSRGDTHKLLLEIDHDLGRYRSFVFAKGPAGSLSAEERAETDALRMKISHEILNLENHFQKLLGMSPSPLKLHEVDDLRIDFPAYQESMRRLESINAARSEAIVAREKASEDGR